MGKFYSNSVSFGVREAFEKGIQADNLIIIAGTRFDTKEQGVIHYGKTYWCGENQEKLVELFSRLWDIGHIIQPRAIYGDYAAPFIGGTLTGRHIFSSVEEMIGDSESNATLFGALINDGYVS